MVCDQIAFRLSKKKLELLTFVTDKDNDLAFIDLSLERFHSMVASEHVLDAIAFVPTTR